jgi:glucose-1-phosphate cytidylyltransferase
MKVVILAGGKGSRMIEESARKPKPMAEIGGKPIIWHIMKLYSHYGFHEFIVCCGYKGHMIKDYFLYYQMYQSDTVFDLGNRKQSFYAGDAEPWKVTLVNTGLETKTAGRILKIADYLDEDENFMLTFGDGVADVDIPKLLAFHRTGGKIVTLTAVQPAGRFGAIQMSEEGVIRSFREKARSDQSWINAGFMVMNKKIFPYLGDGSEMMQDAPFENMAAEGQMAAYRHEGFWAPMDTVHDQMYLEELWDSGQAPWKVWRGVRNLLSE